MTDLERALALAIALDWTPNFGKRSLALVADAIATARREARTEALEEAARAL